MKVKELIEKLQSPKEETLDLEIMIENADMGSMNRVDSIGYHKNYNVYIGTSLTPIKQDIITLVII